MARSRSARVGFTHRLPASTGWVALAIVVVGVVTLPVAITTPPRSGSFCGSDCITYPYTDAADFVPRDYLWMYPATLLAVLFLVLVVHLHGAVEQDARTRAWSGTAVALAVVATTALVVDYGIQLTVVQPSLVKGETDGLTLVSQYNPHGLFIALENVGYLAMGLSLLGIGATLRSRTGLEGVVRLLFVGCGAVTVSLLVVLALVNGSDLEYRFEVWAILVNWLVLTVAGGLLARATYVRR